MQIVVARRTGMLRGGDDGHETPRVQRAGEGGLLDKCDSCAIHLSELHLADLLEQRSDIWSPELEGELGGSEQTMAAARRLAELRRPSQRGHRDRDRAPLARSRARLFELDGDVLMLTGEKRSAVPNAPVSLILEHVRECLVDTPTVAQAGALGHGRADERMPEAEGMQVEVDNACIDGGPSGVEI